MSTEHIAAATAHRTAATAHLAAAEAARRADAAGEDEGDEATETARIATEATLSSFWAWENAEEACDPKTPCGRAAHACIEMAERAGDAPAPGSGRHTGEAAALSTLAASAHLAAAEAHEAAARGETAAAEMWAARAEDALTAC